ncbi:hypothetical protein INR49_012941, partial [Caranx melampygus]
MATPTPTGCAGPPVLCCLGQNNTCRRITCYCDEICLNASDCCTDYTSTCTCDFDHCITNHIQHIKQQCHICNTKCHFDVQGLINNSTEYKSHSQYTKQLYTYTNRYHHIIITTHNSIQRNKQQCDIYATGGEHYFGLRCLFCYNQSKKQRCHIYTSSGPLNFRVHSLYSY